MFSEKGKYAFAVNAHIQKLLRFLGGEKEKKGKTTQLTAYIAMPMYI